MVAMPDEWENRWASEVKTVVKTTGDKSKERWYYQGELELIHGKEEFARFAAKGKWETKEDDDGDIMYRKKIVNTIKDNTTEDKAISGKKMAVDSDTQKVIEDAMSAFGRSKSARPLEDKGKQTSSKKGKKGDPPEPKVQTDEDTCKDKAHAMMRVFRVTEHKGLLKS